MQLFSSGSGCQTYDKVAHHENFSYGRTRKKLKLPFKPSIIAYRAAISLSLAGRLLAFYLSVFSALLFH